jgi:hypothetical protein
VSCPRCAAAAEHCRVETQGHENGAVLWTVFHCLRCSFTWRDTEPARSIDPKLRDPWGRMDPSRPQDYRYNIPPAVEAG